MRSQEDVVQANGALFANHEQQDFDAARTIVGQVNEDVLLERQAVVAPPQLDLRKDNDTAHFVRAHALHLAVRRHH